MSIYNIMAFNAAHDQVQKNTEDAQNIQAKKVQTQQAQEELDLNKKLDVAKAKQAQNEGMMSDYVHDSLEKSINDQYKAKSDQLDAVSGLQDIAQHKAQQGAQQAAQTAAQIHANDPDVQSHVNTLAGIMATQMNGQGSQSSPASVNPSIQDAQTPITSIPGVAPVQGGASPQNVGNQVAPPLQASPDQSSQGIQSTPDQVPQAQQVDPQSHNAPQTPQNGIDLSPVEQAFGMPKGSMWLNPSTMKPEISPIWKSKVEAQQKAQATYDLNQPYREEMREDRNVRAASTILANSVKSGPIAVQNTKVDSAIHARALINQAYDPKTGQYNVSQVPYAELAESLGNLLSGATGSSESRINAIKQRTMAGDVNGALTYITGKPSNATSQDAIKQLVGMIDRQGETSEDLRDKAYDKIRMNPVVRRLNDDDYEYVKSQLPNPGNSFKDALKNAPDRQPRTQVQSNIPQQRPAGATHYSPSTGKFYDDQGNIVQ